MINNNLNTLYGSAVSNNRYTLPPQRQVRRVSSLCCLKPCSDSVSFSKNAKQVFFGSKPLYDVNLKQLSKDGMYKLVKATFSKLDSSDFVDVQALSAIKKSWKSHEHYSDYIVNDFLDGKDDSSFFCVELKDAHSPLESRIMSLVQTTKADTPKSNEPLEIHFLQSSPSNTRGGDGKIKGAGEIAIWGAVKEAKKLGFKSFELRSTVDAFYSRIGLTKMPTGDSKLSKYGLEKSKYNTFIDKTANKYSITEEKHSLYEKSKDMLQRVVNLVVSKAG